MLQFQKAKRPELLGEALQSPFRSQEMEARAGAALALGSDLGSCSSFLSFSAGLQAFAVCSETGFLLLQRGGSRCLVCKVQYQLLRGTHLALNAGQSRAAPQ